MKSTKYSYSKTQKTRQVVFTKHYCMRYISEGFLIYKNFFLKICRIRKWGVIQEIAKVVGWKPALQLKIK